MVMTCRADLTDQGPKSLRHFRGFTVIHTQVVHIHKPEPRHLTFPFTMVQVMTSASFPFNAIALLLRLLQRDHSRKVACRRVLVCEVRYMSLAERA